MPPLSGGFFSLARRWLKGGGLSSSTATGQQQSKAGEAVGTYLKRRAAWKQLKEEAKNQGEVLTAYSFRHRYAKASHALGLPIANIAQAMGHTIEVHLTSYARFTPDATADLYARAQAEEMKSII